jgi:hypothetical protein
MCYVLKASCRPVANTLLIPLQITIPPPLYAWLIMRASHCAVTSPDLTSVRTKSLALTTMRSRSTLGTSEEPPPPPHPLPEPNRFGTRRKELQRVLGHAFPPPLLNWKRAVDKVNCTMEHPPRAELFRAKT